jgi:hypothetical protein
MKMFSSGTLHSLTPACYVVLVLFVGGSIFCLFIA